MRASWNLQETTLPHLYFQINFYKRLRFSEDQHHLDIVKNDFLNTFIKPVYFVVLAKKMTPLYNWIHLAFVFFHTMDVNCFEKKCDLFSCLDFRGDVFKARALPQIFDFSSICFFKINRCYISVCWFQFCHVSYLAF